MKHRLLAAITACVPSTHLFGDHPDSKPQTLNVMSWNVRYDNPRDGANAWKHRRDWVAAIIKREKVDVAGLQEVLLRQLNDLNKHGMVFGPSCQIDESTLSS